MSWLVGRPGDEEQGAAVLRPYGSGRKKQVPHFVRSDRLWRAAARISWERLLAGGFGWFFLLGSFFLSFFLSFFSFS
jgi:hypothetical protein